MEYLRAKLIKTVVDFFEEDFRRIDHALDVLRHAEEIMIRREDCDPEIVLASAILHDIGIKPSEAERGFNNGKTQEEYGPPLARKILARLGLPRTQIEKISKIIGNHHSPSRYDYPELEVLKQADQIVNKKAVA